MNDLRKRLAESKTTPMTLHDRAPGALGGQAACADGKSLGGVLCVSVDAAGMVLVVASGDQAASSTDAVARLRESVEHPS